MNTAKNVLAPRAESRAAIAKKGETEGSKNGAATVVDWVLAKDQQAASPTSGLVELCVAGQINVGTLPQVLRIMARFELSPLAIRTVDPADGLTGLVITLPKSAMPLLPRLCRAVFSVSGLRRVAYRCPEEGALLRSQDASLKEEKSLQLPSQQQYSAVA